jgi:formamidopyrimidine-DNA glycosylase
MPELPEVETIARGLEQRIAGDVFESVWLGSKREPLKSPARQIARTLEGARIEQVHRIGKHVVFELGAPKLPAKKKTEEGSTQFVVHLGMTGSLTVARPGDETAKHTHMVASLRSGRELRFVDPRRFGRLSVRARDLESDTKWAGGSEPLEISEEAFGKLLRQRKAPIKSALLNQKLLRGVGNIYADEALFRAGIRPRRRANTLTRAERKKLLQALQTVLNEAIAAGGSSIADYVDAAGEEGMFQMQHRVYGREDEPCLTCKRSIKRIVLAGRSAHYCPKCQR